MKILNATNTQPLQSEKQLDADALKRETLKVAQKFSEAEKAAEDFETMFVDLMVKAMRSTAKGEEESNAQDIYQGMLDNEYSKAMSAGNGLGIKQTVLDWMKTADPKLTNLDGSAMNDMRESARAAKYAIDQYKIQDALPKIK